MAHDKIIKALVALVCLQYPTLVRGRPDKLCQKVDSHDLNIVNSCPEGYGITEGCCYKCKFCRPGWELRTFQENACPRREPECVPCKDGYYSNLRVGTDQCRLDRNCSLTHQKKVPGTYNRTTPSDCGSCISDDFVFYKNNMNYGCVPAPKPPAVIGTSDAVVVTKVERSEGEGTITVPIMQADKTQPVSSEARYIPFIVLAIMLLVIIVTVGYGIHCFMRWRKEHSTTEKGSASCSEHHAESQPEAPLLTQESSVCEEKFTVENEGVETPNEATPFTSPEPNNIVCCEPQPELQNPRSLQQPASGGQFHSVQNQDSARRLDCSAEVHLQSPSSQSISINTKHTERDSSINAPDRSEGHDSPSGTADRQSRLPNPEQRTSVTDQINASGDRRMDLNLTLPDRSEGGSHNTELPGQDLSGVSQSVEGILSQNSHNYNSRTKNVNTSVIRVASSEPNLSSTTGATASCMRDEGDSRINGSGSMSEYSVSSDMFGSSTHSSALNTDHTQDTDNIDTDSMEVEGTSTHPSDVDDIDTDDILDSSDFRTNDQGKCSRCEVRVKISETFTLCQECQKKSAQRGRFGRQHSFTDQLEDGRNRERRISEHDGDDDPGLIRDRTMVNRGERQLKISQKDRDDATRLIIDRTKNTYGNRRLSELRPHVFEKLTYHLDNTEANHGGMRRIEFATEMGLGNARAGKYSNTAQMWPDLCQREVTIARVIKVLWKMGLKWAVREFCQNITADTVHMCAGE